MAKKNTYQSYPRIDDESSKYHGYLDESKLAPHPLKRFTTEKLYQIIREGIEYANKKSSRKIVSLSEGASEEQICREYKIKGRELFKYFIRYCGDPAATAYECLGQHYSIIAKENFRNKTLQMERMNSGWRYQFIAKDAATLSGRFINVSDLNLKESDFTATIKYIDGKGRLNIYVSIKNRSNTMGGQDWPKAIEALENEANFDKNRGGNYICVFGIAMEKGLRNIKARSKSKQPYSNNTEIWLSDFFWPFFSNYSYEEITKAVLDILIKEDSKKNLGVEMPDQMIKEFWEWCSKYELLNSEGIFNNAERLVELFCGNIKI